MIVVVCMMLCNWFLDCWVVLISFFVIFGDVMLLWIIMILVWVCSLVRMLYCLLVGLLWLFSIIWLVLWFIS